MSERARPAKGGTIIPERVVLARSASNTVGSYKNNGTETTPTIKGLDSPWDVAVDANREFYVVDNSDYLTIYKRNGKPTGHTITESGDPHEERGVAVDANGKIYITNGDTVTTYDPKGNPTTPTISGLQFALGVAVDANGKIYVADQSAGTLTTYAADGTPTTPTISGLSAPTSVAVDVNGKIYVAQSGNGEVTTYAADGTPTKPTISTPSGAVWGVAVSLAGKIYVTDGEGGHLYTFTPSGRQSDPTITTEDSLNGIALVYK